MPRCSNAMVIADSIDGLITGVKHPKEGQKPSYCAAAPTPNSFSFEQMNSIGGPAEVGGCKGNRPKWDDAWHPLHRTR